MKNKNFAGNLFAPGEPKSLTIKETPLSAQIAEWLDARHIYNDCLNCGRIETKRGHRIALCKTGTPAGFAILSGQIVFIEVKKFGETSSAEQLEKHDELRASGAIVVSADTFNEFVSKFSAIRAAVNEREKELLL